MLEESLSLSMSSRQSHHGQYLSISNPCQKLVGPSLHLSKSPQCQATFDTQPNQCVNSIARQSNQQCPRTTQTPLRKTLELFGSDHRLNPTRAGHLDAWTDLIPKASRIRKRSHNSSRCRYQVQRYFSPPRKKESTANRQIFQPFTSIKSLNLGESGLGRLQRRTYGMICKRAFRAIGNVTDHSSVRLPVSVSSVTSAKEKVGCLGGDNIQHAFLPEHESALRLCMVEKDRQKKVAGARDVLPVRTE